MQQAEYELLKDIYNYYLEHKTRECSVPFTNLTPREKRDIMNSLDYLEECGYIRYTARALGFDVVQITVDGIKFVENGFQDPLPAPMIQGDNNIFITGSDNTVTGNYNKISLDIANSELPEDCKALIQSFLYEMKNPHLTPEKKTDKIKSFLSDISSGTISGVAASGLSTLLFHLLSNISL